MGAAPPVCIGILARNEERGIGALIDDLAKQTLLATADIPVHLVIVANGCSDRTAHIARQAFAGSAFARPNLQTAVHELPRPVMSNAWN
jgi:glycosyltransferase involved in cell wall biosynthesis